jgi:hypothetical protein
MSLSPVKLGFVRRGLAGGNNPDHRFSFTIAVANHHEPKMETKDKQKESILPLRMLVIIELRSKIVIENGLRFLKRYAVIPEVLFGLCGIPLKSNFWHVYIVFTIKN